MTIEDSSHTVFTGNQLPARDEIGKPSMPDQDTLLICPTCYEERDRAVVLKSVPSDPLPPVFRFPGQRPNESAFSIHRTSDRFACPECPSEYMDAYDPKRPAPPA